jgi:hypothetical protein
MRVGGRQVQEVARGERGVMGGRKAAQDLDGQACAQCEIVLAPIPPASPPESLQQEYIVGIEMWSDAAARRGVAHHQVVEASVGQERELTEQRVGVIAVQVDALHEQRPVAGGKRAEIRAAKRTVGNGKSGFRTNDDPRFDVVALRQCEQLRTREQTGKGGHRLAHQQGLFVPMLREERTRCAAEQRVGRGRGNAHRSQAYHR